MIPNIIFTNIPAFLPGLIGLTLFLSVIFIVLSLMGLFIRKRSTISGIMFFLAVSAICTFICNFTINELLLIEHIRNIGIEFGVGEGIASAIQAIASLVFHAHKFFVSIVASLFSLDPSDEKLSFINNGILIMLGYIVLFLLSFILFNRKKKTKKIYSDYLS